MRILVYEFFSGGGRAGRALPASLSREGAAMLSAVVSDLAAVNGHHVVTTRDPRFSFRAPRDVEVIELTKSGRTLGELIASCDAVWLIAPETNGCLEHLARSVEQQNKILLSCSSAAIRRASNKAELHQFMATAGLAHPETRALGTRFAGLVQARDLGFPVVVKPATGAGCEGVSVARNPAELRQALRVVRRSGARGPIICQKYVHGTPASVSLIADGQRAVSLAVNAQRIVGARPCTYRGGWTPLQHPMAGRAAEVAEKACSMFPGLRGFVGVDLVLTKSEVFVVEINPRVTTAYLGVRAVLGGNMAAMVLDAAEGLMPTPSRPTGKVVTFTCSGVL